MNSDGFSMEAADPAFKVTLFADDEPRVRVRRLPVPVTSWEKIARRLSQVMAGRQRLLVSIASMDDLHGPFVLRSFDCTGQGCGEFGLPS